jgi:malate synthase
MGGMAAQIPIKGDAAANDAAIAKVRADKQREAGDGFDGTWVAHPGLVPVAKAVFDAAMPGPNQIHRKREDVHVGALDLLAFGPQAPITEAGLRANINIALQYLASWLGGNGCVPINHLMEDAATAEISRSQIWHWIRSPRGVLEDGRKVTAELFRTLLPEELEKARASDSGGMRRRFDEASRLLERLVAGEDFVEFLTEPAYEYVASYSGARS